MAAASDVTFDVLLGGKVTAQLLKSFKDLEELMKKQGATAKTINAVMGRAYKDTFDGVAKDAKKDFGEVEKSARHSFHEVVERAREAQKQIAESFDKMRESYEKFAELVKKPLEWIGLTGVISGASAALGGAELLKEGIKVHRARETETATLRATLAGRGAGAQAAEWEEAAERIAHQARIGHEEAMKMMTKLAVSGRFRTAEQAQQMALALIGLGGGTAEGAEAARAAYGKTSIMMMAGKVRPTAIAGIGGGAGLGGALLQRIAADTGIPITDLAKQFAPAKVSRRTGEVTGGALAGAKGIEALNKAILELGQSRGFAMIEAKMKGMEGMFYRFGEHWEDFVNKIGEAFEDFIAPIADRVNKLLDSINFEAVFEGMIEKAKEWGHLIAAVWDTIANAPILKTITSLWDDFWKSFGGGAELYGPYIKTVIRDHGELKTVMARHPTELFYTLRDVIGKKLTDAIKGITETVTAIGDLWKKTELLRVALGKLGDALKAIDDFIYGHLLPTLTDLSAKGWQQIVKFAQDLANVFKGLIDKIVSWIPDWLKPGALSAGDQARMERIEKAGTPAARAAAQQGAQYAARTNDQAAEAALRQADSLEKLNALDEQIRKTQELHKKAIEDSTDALRGRSPGFIPAINDAILSLDAFAKKLQTLSGNDLAHLGADGGFGGEGTAGTGGPIRALAFGPGSEGATAEDARQVTGAFGNRLTFGDYAVSPNLAAGHYPFQKFQFTDAAGHIIIGRYADKSYYSANNPTSNTIEQWGGKNLGHVSNLQWLANGGIFRRPTPAMIGESGPEAVIPLQGAGAAAAGLGGLTINVNVAGNAHDPEGIAEAVERVIRQHWRRAAVV